MRKPPKLLIWILILIGCAVVDARTPSVNEILKTQQYVFIVQQGQTILVEREVSKEGCPTFMNSVSSSFSESTRYTGLHLYRDPGHLLPTKLMTLEKSKVFLDVYLHEINGTKVFDNSNRKQLRLENAALRSRTQQGIGNPDALRNSLYDYTRQMIYLDYSTPDFVDIQKHYVHQSLGGGIARFSESKTIKQVMNNSRVDWTEDPYSDLFYYTEHFPDGSQLFKAPLGLFERIILKQANGTFVRKLSENELFSGVSRGTIFTSEKTDENFEIRNSIVGTSRDAEMVCVMSSPIDQLQFLNKVLVLRDEDYCMLRDGLDYDNEKCTAEQNGYMEELISRNKAEDEEGSVLKWLIIACAVMFLIIVLMCVYVFWLRSSFVVDDEQSHQNEYDTEASLFVSKQRSFPSAYQDPALLDVSVDKWN